MRPKDLASPLQVVRLMLTALAILFLGVSVYAYAWGGQSLWSVHAPGDDDPTGMLHQLRREGMDCHPRPGRTDIFDCAYRQPTLTDDDFQRGRSGLPRASGRLELASR